MNKLVLLDAYALIYRAFYALMRSPRINSKGFNTSTVFGFVNTLKEILDKEKPTHIGIAFDPKGPTFRHEAFPQYKAQREKTPEGIQESVPIIKDIIRAFNITIFEEPGYEADDVIGTLATRAATIGFETFMVTPDKDYCQLVTNNIRIIRPSHGKSQAEILGPTEVNQKYSLSSPLQVIDMLGLMGDSADNVPGCPNVGEKTAVSLINKFGSIEGIYEHIEEVKGKLQENLIQNKEQVLFSKFLVTIKTDVPILFDEEQVRLKEIDKTKVRKIFEELEFRSLLKSICGVEEKSEPKGPVQLDLFGNFSGESPTDSKKTNLSASKTIQARYEIADTKEKRESFLKKNQEEKTVGLAIATTSTVAIDAKIIGFSLASSDGHTIYIPFKENDADAVNYIRAILSDKNTTKVGFNLKYVLLVLRRYNIELKGKLFDVMLAHYVIQPEQKHFLASMADTYLHSDTINIDSFFSGKMKTTWNMEVLPLNVCADSTSQRADFCMRLKPLLEDELNKNKEYQLFEDIEMPLMPVLTDMEYNGVTIDTNVLKDISVLFNERLKNYEKQVHDISGRDFNISSPRQVGEILFDVLKLDSKAKKTKTGQYETSEATLEALRYKSPIIEPILCYRAMKKLLSTYVDALPTLVNPQTQHIHTSFNQAVTATGRLSSSDPNLQNIPVRGEDGKEIRKAFIPEPGQLFFSADYSQIELRILAHLSNDEQMKMAFIEGHDIHAATAAKIYHKDIKDVTTDERRKAKTANFGIVYGITTFGLSQRIGISRSEAKELIDSYFATFSNIKSYIEQIVETARQQGYVETIFRRRRYLPDINSQNAVVRKFAERNAVNAPIQGSAADIIKVAMIRIAKRFKEENIQSKMILQVHDELNFSVLPEEKERVQAIVQYEMAHACNLSVPLVADCGWGKNWLESH
jgi:DNA polymerase-1